MINLLFKYQRIVKYLISGGTSALVDLGLLYFFTDILGIWYLISASLAFAIAFFVSFFLQKFWTFRDSDKDVMYKQMGVYLGVAIANFLINIVLMYTLVDGLKLWYMLAQFLASGLIAGESYLVYKIFIFNSQTASGQNGRILIATGIYPPDYRGPATMLEALPQALKEKGFAVKVITYSSIASSAEGKGRVYRIRRDSLWRHAKYFFTLFYLAGWADLIYATDLYSVGYFSYLINKLTGKKYLIRFAGDSAWETAVRLGLTQDYISDFQKKKYGRRIEKIKTRREKIMINADRIVAVSNFLAGVALAIGVDKENIRVIYNSVDFIGGDIDLVRVGQIRQPYGREAKIMVSAGELNPWKGFDGIIKSLPLILEKTGLKLHLLILGQGQEMENLKKLSHELGVAGVVHFLGRIEHKDIMNYFKAADLFILNSHYEGQSHTLLEAMKAGTPVIASDIEANREVIESGREGVLVKYNDACAIGQAAVKILMDRDLAKNFASAAKAKLKIFNWQKNIEQTVETINELL